MAGEYRLRTERRQLNELQAAEYNPRKDLQPTDAEWQNIARSLEAFGYADPIIINEDGTIIGGHQRAKVMQALGETEAEVVVVSLDKSDEKALNIALNKIGGQWDIDKLRDALGDIDTSSLDPKVTGFTGEEIRLLLNGPDEEPNNDDPDINRITFVLSLDQFAAVERARALVRTKYTKEEFEEYGNTNKVGNEIFKVVEEWAELRK